MKQIYYLLLVLFVSGFSPGSKENIAQDDPLIEWENAQEYDIVVVGVTPAGVAVAIAAKTIANTTQPKC